jgi:hypothetical protein
MNTQSIIVSTIFDISGIILNWVAGNPEHTAILPLNITDYNQKGSFIDNYEYYKDYYVPFIGEDELSYAEKGLVGHIQLHMNLDIIDPALNLV